MRGGLVRLAALGRPRRFAAGEVLMRQGDPSDALYVILRGRLRIERSLPDFAEPLLLEEVAGESAAVGDRLRSAAKRAEDLQVALEGARRHRDHTTPGTPANTRGSSAV